MTDKSENVIHRLFSGEISPSERADLFSRFPELNDPEVLKQYQNLWDGMSEVDEDLHLDIEAGWNRFRKTHMQEDQVIPDQTPVRRFTFIKIAAVLIGLGLITWFLIDPFKSQPQEFNGNLVATNKILTQKLPDGSTVTLNKNSSLSYQISPISGIRNVTLEGEAMFSVEHNAKAPFRVKATGFEVTVLGTQFSVSSLPGQNGYVSVKEGKVKVDVNGKQAAILTQHQALEINSGKTMAYQDLEENGTAWMNGFLIFRKTPLYDALKQIQQSYHIYFVYDEQVPLNCYFTARFTTGELDDVLTALSKTFNMQVQKIGSNIYQISGGNCE